MAAKAIHNPHKDENFPLKTEKSPNSYPQWGLAVSKLITGLVTCSVQLI